jgi:glycosyltransferase involved in cell wall biosynthesis
MPRATVIVPTHRHAETLPLAVGSALRQTESDLEIVILGDGVDEGTRAAARSLAAGDPRVRFADLPKGPGHGFAHRQQAVADASSKFVFWLSDDDLWFPDHVERLATMLEEAHLVASLIVGVHADGTIQAKPFDLATRWARARLAARRGSMPMSTIAHRRKAFLRLPRGWLVDELHYRDVWGQFGAMKKAVLASLLIPTALHMPSGSWDELTLDERVAQLKRWSATLSDERCRREFLEDVVAHLAEVGWVSRQEDRYAATSRHSGSGPAVDSGGRRRSRSDNMTSARETGQGTPRAGSSKATPRSSSGSQ